MQGYMADPSLVDISDYYRWSRRRRAGSGKRGNAESKPEAPQDPLLNSEIYEAAQEAVAEECKEKGEDNGR